MLAVKAKIYGVSIINPALSLLMKHLFIGQRQKAPNFLAFHWSPHESLVYNWSAFRHHEGSKSIGQHFVTTRVVHLLTRTETSLTKGGGGGGGAVHSCNSWFVPSVSRISQRVSKL